MFFYAITVWLVMLGWYDCCYRRLPNYLTLGGAALFLLLRLGDGGWGSCWNALLGGVIGGAFLLLPFLMRGAGAGDLKMFFAVGILVGYPGIFLVMILASVFGLILGAGMLLTGKCNGGRLKHWWRCCTRLNYNREEGRKALPEKTNEAVRIPFGVAIAAATWVGILIYALFNK
ncbi:MAG: A24 family peptidase [Victivallaceae bacterium]